MTPEDFKKHSEIIDDSVTFIEHQTEAVWERYEEIAECLTKECNEEKESLRYKMNGYLKKLEEEEKMIDQYEEMLHNTTGTQ